MEIASYVWVTRGDFRISPRMYQVADMWQGLSESAEFPTDVKEVMAMFGAGTPTNDSRKQNS